MKRKKYFVKFIRWRTKHISNSFFIILLSILVGFLSGIAAYLLKITVNFIKTQLFDLYSSTEQILLFFILPITGIFLTVILKFIFKDSLGFGIPRVLYVISKLDGSMRKHTFFTSLFGGALTAGFGGSVGLESPIIFSGASIGSWLGQFMKLDYKYKVMLMGSGAAGAIASIFTTPITAIVFVFEVLMLDLTTSAIVPILLSAVTGAVTTKVLLAEQILIHFKVTKLFVINDIFFFAVLGIIAGFVSVYFHFIHFEIMKFFKPIRSVWLRLLIGGSLLGFLVYLFPPFYSEGYTSIRLILNGDPNQLFRYSQFGIPDNTWWVVVFAFFLIVFKIFATTFTTEAGGIGGIFAPAAVTGGYTGFVLVTSLNLIFPGIDLHVNNFTLVGMAAVLGGVLQAPLTGIFLIAEMSKGYELIVPLMLSTSISFVIARTFNKYSIFTKQLSGLKNTFHYRDFTAFKELSISGLLEKNVLSISVDATLKDLVELIKISKRNVFIVLNGKDFAGVIHLDDVRKDMFDPSKYDTPVTEYIYVLSEDDIVDVRTDMHEIIDKLDRTGSYNIIVLRDTKYVGLVSKANLLKRYRESLLESDETI